VQSWPHERSWESVRQSLIQENKICLVKHQCREKKSDATNLHQHIFIRLPWTSYLQSWKLRACVLPIFTGRSYQAAFTAISTLRTGDDAHMKCLTTKKNGMKFANYPWLGLFLPSKLLFPFRSRHFLTTVMGAIWLPILPPWLNPQYPLPTFLFDDRFTHWTLLIAWWLLHVNM
jgi:hypothetical protein